MSDDVAEEEPEEITVEVHDSTLGTESEFDSEEE
jgi:hypothetical protein